MNKDEALRASEELSNLRRIWRAVCWYTREQQGGRSPGCQRGTGRRARGL